MVLLGYREAVSGVVLVVSARSGGVSAWEGAGRDEEHGSCGFSAENGQDLLIA